MSNPELLSALWFNTYPVMYPIYTDHDSTPLIHKLRRMGKPVPPQLIVPLIEGDVYYKMAMDGMCAQNTWLTPSPDTNWQRCNDAMLYPNNYFPGPI